MSPNSLILPQERELRGLKASLETPLAIRPYNGEVTISRGLCGAKAETSHDCSIFVRNSNGSGKTRLCLTT